MINIVTTSKITEDATKETAKLQSEKPIIDAGLAKEATKLKSEKPIIDVEDNNLPSSKTPKEPNAKNESQMQQTKNNREEDRTEISSGATTDATLSKESSVTGANIGPLTSKQQPNQLKEKSSGATTYNNRTIIFMKALLTIILLGLLLLLTLIPTLKIIALSLVKFSLTSAKGIQFLMATAAITTIFLIYLLANDIVNLTICYHNHANRNQATLKPTSSTALTEEQWLSAPISTTDTEPLQRKETTKTTAISTALR